MPRYIVKLQRDSQTWYLEYSSVVDAPATFGLPLEDFTKNYLYYYGQHSKDELAQRLARGSNPKGNQMTKEDWKELMFAVKTVSFTFAFFAMAMALIYAIQSYAESKCTEGEIYDGKICENHRMRNFNLKDLEQYPGLGGLAKPKSKTIIVPIITR